MTTRRQITGPVGEEQLTAPSGSGQRLGPPHRAKGEMAEQDVGYQRNQQTLAPGERDLTRKRTQKADPLTLLRGDESCDRGRRQQNIRIEKNPQVVSRGLIELPAGKLLAVPPRFERLPRNQSNASIRRRQLTHQFGGAIGAVVIEHHKFQIDRFAGEDRRERRSNSGYFVPRRDEDGNLQECVTWGQGNGTPVLSQIAKQHPETDESGAQTGKSNSEQQTGRRHDISPSCDRPDLSPVHQPRSARHQS